MDCEKLDELAIDLVDPDGADAIDARAQREAEQHLAACTRCAAVIERLRGGMRAAAALELEDPSSLLEARILAAAGAAQPDVPFRRRFVRAISTAGSWAMRPQVAMAAVLVVMVGTSIVLLRGGGLPSARRTKVTDEGTPVATLEPTGAPEQGAPAVIGGEKKADKEDKPKEQAAPRAVPLPKTDLPAASEAETTTKNEEKAKAKDEKAVADEGDDFLADKSLAAGKVPTKAAPPPPPVAPAAPPMVASPADLDGMAKGGAGAKKSAAATPGAAAGPMPSPTSAAPSTGSASSYDEAMTAYKEARWAAAAKGFETSAAAGQKAPSSLLYAARSYRAAGSCVQALPRFQKLVTTYPAAPEAPHGALEGGQCAKALGDTATARSLFEKAKTYPATQKQAESELAALNQPPAAPPAKAAKPSSTVDSPY